MGIVGGIIIGGRGSYSIRKAFSNTIFTKATPVAKTLAAASPARVRGNFGGGTDSGRQTSSSMDAEFSNWRKNLTEKQISAFASYTNGGYRRINNILRGKDTGNEYTKNEVKNLKAAFNHTLSKPVTVYRGTGTTSSSLSVEMSTVGGVFRDKGAFSTSLSKTFARKWAKSKTDNAIVYTIRLPKGYKGAAWVHSISPHKHEKELLIRPGQNWRVVKELRPLKDGNKKIKHVLIQPV